MIVRMSTQASNTTRSWYAHSTRPSIGQPSEFRRVDGVNVPQRNSFRPLELSIVLSNGRLSPLPDFSGDIADPATELQMPQKAFVRSRSDSVLSTDRLSNFTIQRKPVSSAFMPDDRQSVRSSIVCGPTLTETRERDASKSGSASIQSLPVSYSSRSFSPHRLSSIGSRGNLNYNRPRASTESRRARIDIDEAISELNTIVEERRGDALRNSNGSGAKSTTSEHIPAIAPGMKVHARSQTLSEIGSAFSLPLAMKPLPAVPRPSSRVATVNNAEDDSEHSQSSCMSNSSLDLRPHSASTRGVCSSRSKPALAVSVKAMCEEIESAKIPQKLLNPDNSAPISAPSEVSASLSQRLNTWLRRSLPSSPTTPTPSKTVATSPDATPHQITQAKSAFVASTRPAAPLSPPASFTTPPRQRATSTPKTRDSTGTNDNTFFSTSTFTSPSVHSTPSLISNASSVSTLTTSPPGKHAATTVAEREVTGDLHFGARSVSRPVSESELTPTPGMEMDLEVDYDSEDDAFPLPTSAKQQLPVRQSVSIPEQPSAAQMQMSMSMSMPAPLSSSLVSPPAYQELDPHLNPNANLNPNSHPNTPVSPVVVGLAL